MRFAPDVLINLFTRRRARDKCWRWIIPVEARRYRASATPNFGDYDIILPPEPFVWGVSHIRPRTVQGHIERPVYAVPGWNKEGGPDHGDPYEGDGIIPLGGEEEARLRRAAQLAKLTRDYVATLVQVRVVLSEDDLIELLSP